MLLLPFLSKVLAFDAIVEFKSSYLFFLSMSSVSMEGLEDWKSAIDVV